jgi:predicted dehydrogenase
MTGRRPRLAVVGVGAWGRNIVRAIENSVSADLVRVASRSQPPAQAVPAHIPVDADWRDTLDADIDGVVVATPAATHAEIGCAVLDAGHDLFIEKPLALSPGDAEELLARAETAGSAVLVDHIYLFHPAWPAFRRLAGETASIQRITGCFGQAGPFRENVPLLWDWGPHVVALCLDLFGRTPDKAAIERVDCRTTASGTGETLVIHLTFGETLASLTISNLLDSRSRMLMAVCDDRTLVFADGADAPLSVQRGGTTTPVAVPDAQPLDRAIAAFAAASVRRQRGDGVDLAPLMRGVETIQILDALASCPA